MATVPPASVHGRPTSFSYSNLALIVTVAGAALTVAPIARADVTFVGLGLIWFGLYLFMRRSGPNLRYWATLMVAVLIWVSLAAASGAFGRVGATSGQQARDATPTQTRANGVDLRAEVRFTGAQFVVANRGSAPWRDVVLELRDDQGGDAYEVRLERLAAGRSATVQLARFTTAGGRAFSMSAGGFRSLLITAHTGDGQAPGSYEARWD